MSKLLQISIALIGISTVLFVLVNMSFSGRYHWHLLPLTDCEWWCDLILAIIFAIGVILFFTVAYVTNNRHAK